MLRIELKGDKEIERELQRLSSIRFDAVVLKSMTQIYNRGKAGGTPVDTGELRMSLGQAGETVGYTASYSGHVEFGHRTRGGNGYVPGQYYLKKNVETQRPIYYQDLRDQLNKG